MNTKLHAFYPYSIKFSTKKVAEVVLCMWVPNVRRQSYIELITFIANQYLSNDIVAQLDWYFET